MHLFSLYIIFIQFKIHAAVPKSRCEPVEVSPSPTDPLYIKSGCSVQLTCNFVYEGEKRRFLKIVTKCGLATYSIPRPSIAKAKESDSEGPVATEREKGKGILVGRVYPFLLIATLFSVIIFLMYQSWR